MVDEAGKEVLRTRTVELLLEVRAAYLKTGGANVLKHWTLLENRLVAAAKTCASPEEVASRLCRNLQVQSLGSAGARALLDLVHAVAERDCKGEWLDLVEREHGYLIALTRLSAEKRQESRDGAS